MYLDMAVLPQATKFWFDAPMSKCYEIRVNPIMWLPVTYVWKKIIIEAIVLIPSHVTMQ